MSLIWYGSCTKALNRCSSFKLGWHIFSFCWHYLWWLNSMCWRWAKVLLPSALAALLPWTSLLLEDPSGTIIYSLPNSLKGCNHTIFACHCCKSRWLLYSLWFQLRAAGFWEMSSWVATTPCLITAIWELDLLKLHKGNPHLGHLA